MDKKYVVLRTYANMMTLLCDTDDEKRFAELWKKYRKEPGFEFYINRKKIKKSYFKPARDVWFGDPRE